ncbi:hypothetical protein F511_02763 [Dorcoceras hygrometricum]|uniref:Uncharacterized protein n=1 Tax=Dorcoceras hygrometricum TaxID=472368 RepID=A0A2Z7DEB7_9LAMI|nr:hypothetical protein F511_02763 [Dorcoceras hygrometricum]
MEFNDIDVDGVMETAPTVGSQAVATTPSHSQNESVSLDANETPKCDILDSENMIGGSKRKFRSAAWAHFDRKIIGGKWKAIYSTTSKDQSFDDDSDIEEQVVNLSCGGFKVARITGCNMNFWSRW